MPMKTNYEKAQISKSEPKKFSYLCNFKQVLCLNTGFLIEAHDRPSQQLDHGRQ
jgi:hypothetical protein